MLIRYEEALERTANTEKNLLLGNGFSISQTRGTFSYSNLLEETQLTDTDPIKNLFRLLITVDFEVVIHALEHAAKVEEAYGELERKRIFEDDADRVREALITAIHTVHPEIQFEIPENEIEAGGQFLGSFRKIFNLNYDLLVYWINLNHTPRVHSDGFGLSEERNGFLCFKENAHCSVYNLHGGLHLFKDENDDTQKRVALGNSTIIQSIERTIRTEKKLPMFVAEGTSKQKLRKISSIPYLKHGLEMLESQTAPIFVFGHSADINDTHIYEAIFLGQSEEIYFFVHEPNTNLIRIQENLARFSVRAPGKAVHYIDAAEVDIWGRT